MIAKQRVFRYAGNALLFYMEPLVPEEPSKKEGEERLQELAEEFQKRAQDLEALKVFFKNEKVDIIDSTILYWTEKYREFAKLALQLKKSPINEDFNEIVKALKEAKEPR